jgi:hypothetical protein
VLDATYLAQSGAVAGLPQAEGLLLVPVRATARVWTGNTVPVSPVLVRRSVADAERAVLALSGN